MAISSISTDSAVHPIHRWNQSRQVRMDVKALKTMLASSDLSGAQTAFATLTQDAQTITRKHERGHGELHRHDSAESISSNAFTDFASLENALQTNDLPAAQKAFVSMIQELGAKPHNLAGAPRTFTLMVQSLQKTVPTLSSSTGGIVNTTV